jgi:hypothetical protein
MPKVHLNTALTGLSGTLDGRVYRRYRGRVVLQRRPVFRRPWSDAQTRTCIT